MTQAHCSCRHMCAEGGRPIRMRAPESVHLSASTVPGAGRLHRPGGSHGKQGSQKRGGGRGRRARPAVTHREEAAGAPTPRPSSKQTDQGKKQLLGSQKPTDGRSPHATPRSQGRHLPAQSASFTSPPWVIACHPYGLTRTHLTVATTENN